MNKEMYSELTDEQLLLKKKDLKKKKVINALLIGFLAGIIAFGMVSWGMSAKKNVIAFLLPMLFPIYFIFRIMKKSKKEETLEKTLNERNLM